MKFETIESAVIGMEEESDIIIGQDTSRHHPDESHVSDDAHPDTNHHPHHHQDDEEKDHVEQEGDEHEQGHEHEDEGQKEHRSTKNMKNAGTIVTLLIVAIIGIASDIQAKSIDQIIESDIFENNAIEREIAINSIDESVSIGITGENKNISNAIEKADISDGIISIAVIDAGIIGGNIEQSIDIERAIVRDIASSINRIDTINDIAVNIEEITIA